MFIEETYRCLGRMIELTNIKLHFLTNWMRSTFTMESNMQYSKSIEVNVNFTQTPSQKHLE